MKPLNSVLICLLAIAAGCATPRPLAPPPTTPRVQTAVTAIAFSKAGDRLYFAREASAGCDLSAIELSGATRSLGHVTTCPSAIRELADGQLLLLAGGRGQIFGGAASSSELIDSAGSLRILDRDRNIVLVSDHEQVLGSDAGLRLIRILPQSGAVVGIRSAEGGEQLVRIDKPMVLSEKVEAIDSWDYSPDEKEVVFSAKKNGDYNVAISSLTEEKVSWLPSDPQPEVHVSWAPRGHKVSYVVQRSEGSFIRTVHLPTGFQLTVPFPSSSVDAIAWEPKAERFAVIVSSPQFSPRVDVLKYGGEERKTLVASTEADAVESDTFAWKEGSALLIPPATIRYSHKNPVVVWLGVEDPLQWSSPRVELRRRGETGQIVVPAAANVSPGFWTELLNQPWIDGSRIAVVLVAPQPAATLSTLPEQATVFVPQDRMSAVARILPLERLRPLDSDRSDVESAAVREIASFLGRPESNDARH
jgi:hypothetical protein